MWFLKADEELVTVLGEWALVIKYGDTSIMVHIATEDCGAGFVRPVDYTCTKCERRVPDKLLFMAWNCAEEP
jgi:hypothetical protein